MTITYELKLESGESKVFRVELDSETLFALRPENQAWPEWTKLDNCKCPNCPLPSRPGAHCPAATQVADVVSQFAETWSFEATEVRVQFSGRTTSKGTDAQAALGSLLGLYLATSGCPILGQLRPLVRFHQPFATELETIFRVTSMYLVAQFLHSRSGGSPDWDLQGLKDLYAEIGKVNQAFASRLLKAAPRDANLNALIMLDAFSKALPEKLEDKLAVLRPLLTNW